MTSCHSLPRHNGAVATVLAGYHHCGMEASAIRKDQSPGCIVGDLCNQATAGEKKLKILGQPWIGMKFGISYGLFYFLFHGISIVG